MQGKGEAGAIVRPAGPGARANWLSDGLLRHGLRAYAPWVLHRLAAPASRFVILTTGRCGSELLVSLLNSHPQISCDSEILGIRRIAPLRLIESRAALAGLRGARAYGFKMLPRDLQAGADGDPAGRLRELHRRGFAMIRLERRDLLQQAVSHARASAGEYRHHRHSERAAFTAQPVDPVGVLAAMFILELEARLLASALDGIPHLRLFYEDHLLEPGRQQETVDRIAGELGLAARAVASELVRVTPRRTRDLVSNYDELARAVAATRFARCLEPQEPAL
jgi:LPS sulfotransferase NodH